MKVFLSETKRTARKNAHPREEEAWHYAPALGARVRQSTHFFTEGGFLGIKLQILLRENFQILLTKGGLSTKL